MTDKTAGSDNIIICDDSKIVSKQNVFEVLNNYFSTLADNIGIPDKLADEDDITSIINHHQHHPSIKAIKERHPIINTFDFMPCSESDTHKLLQDINVRKATGYDNLPPKIINLCASELANSFSSLINTCVADPRGEVNSINNSWLQLNHVFI